MNDLPAPPEHMKDWPWFIYNDNNVESNENKNNTYPKISIVTPSYNQGKYIEKTIRSVLQQRYPNLEYIIIDGGSKDNSVDIIKKYEKWITYWESEPDRGQAHAINKGFQRATGEICAWLNSDDYYLSGALIKVAKAFHEYPDTHVIVGVGHKVLDNGKIIYTPRIPELSFNAFLNWMEYSHFMQPSCFFRAQAWKECGPLRENLHFCFDVDLWLKMAEKFAFKKLDASLSHAIIHPEAKTTAEKEKMKIETSLLVSQYGGYEIAKKTLFEMAEMNLEQKKQPRYMLPAMVHKLMRDLYGPFQRLVKSFYKLI
jgi:glycosyltransferase involved in cell wall biosynthesis